jgi:hypothetical protein
MKRLLMLLIGAAPLGAQDSTAYRELWFRASAIDNVHAGAIDRDWKPLIGKQVEVATPLSVGELGLAVGRIHYKPLTGHPAYKATLITLSWLTPELVVWRARLAGGARFSDYRMDFDDPSVVSGLRTEEEVMPAVIVRGRIVASKRASVFADASYGVLMLGHRTRMVLLSGGAQYALPTPSWLQGIMR